MFLGGFWLSLQSLTAIVVYWLSSPTTVSMRLPDLLASERGTGFIAIAKGVCQSSIGLARTRRDDGRPGSVLISWSGSMFSI